MPDQTPKQIPNPTANRTPGRFLSKGALTAAIVAPLLAMAPLSVDRAAAADRAGTQLAQTIPVSVAERDAFEFRRLQTELMVAALACRSDELRARYESFVLRFRPALKRNADKLKASFYRAHGKGGQRRMDAFVTGLANDAAVSAIKQNDFCTRAASRLDALSLIPVESAPSRLLQQADAGTVR